MKLKESLVNLASPSKATQELFWVGPRNFEPRSDAKGDDRAGTPSPRFLYAPAGKCLDTMYDLFCNRPHTRLIFSDSSFEPGTLRSQNQDFTAMPPYLH
ncbi:hypothetical protein AVEN_107830-1 [Araneus ventricosus]|uniref:Uncharacterized protein n=1 Tax=Araneus ventricosus TaxID=182803 RepID=A0A4Y2JDB2_ARAVE|nr:hypothetical protein AVEN_107830-1 [Araneus ventricosus]